MSTHQNDSIVDDVLGVQVRSFSLKFTVSNDWCCSTRSADIREEGLMFLDLPFHQRLRPSIDPIERMKVPGIAPNQWNVRGDDELSRGGLWSGGTRRDAPERD